jgi:uncharacterized protein (TIGR02466 family)
MGKVYDVFGVPIYETVIDSDRISVVQSEIENSFNDLVSKGSFSRPRAWIYQDTHNVSDSTFSTNFLDDYDLKEVKEEIKKSLCSYLDAVSYNSSYQYKIASSWLTLTKKGEYAHIHSHSHFDISGAYYFRTNGEDGDLFFEHPLDIIKSSIYLKNLPNRTLIKPYIGKMVLFPSWFKHGVKPNQTDNERISLSFNIELKR